MANHTSNLTLKPAQNDMENDLQDLFIDYLSKARDIASLTHNGEHNIDSEVALHMRYMLDQYDKFRARKVVDDRV